MSSLCGMAGRTITKKGIFSLKIPFTIWFADFIPERVLPQALKKP